MNEIKNFAWPVTSVNKEDYRVFCEWFMQNESVIRQNKIVIWGAGIRGTEFSVFFEKFHYTCFCFTDNNAEKWGGRLNCYEILPPAVIHEKMKSGGHIIVIATETYQSIVKDLAAYGYKINRDFYIVKTELYQKYIEEFYRHYSQKVLFMGDCGFSHISLHDTDTRNLGDMLISKLGSENVKVLAMHGMGLRSQYNVFNAQLQNGFTPQILIIMVNFDTLTGKQHLLPRSQHVELLENLYDSLPVKNEEFEKYLSVVQDRNENIQVEFLTKKKASSLNEIQIRNYFRLNYLYDMDINTEGVCFLKKIMDLAIRTGITAIPFIPPVNFELGEKFFQNKFTERYQSNVSKIRSVLSEYGIEPLDFSYSLKSGMFAEPNTPDETVNENGRLYLTGSFLQVLEDVYAK